VSVLQFSLASLLAGLVAVPRLHCLGAWSNRVARAMVAGLFSSFILLSAGTVRADEAPLEVGVFPYLSTQTILTTYQPVRSYLETVLKRPVHLSTAQDFPAFVARTQDGDYDLVITAPHFARLAQREAGYVPLVQYTPELRGLVVVAANGPVKSATALRGQSIAVPSRLAIVSMMGLRYLATRGLKPGRDFTVQVLSSHTSAVLSVKNGENVAAITEASALRQMTPELVRSVRVLANTGQVQSVVFLAHARLTRAERERLKSALLHFAQDTEAGRAFLKSSGYNGLRAVTETDLRKLDPYLDEVKEQLRAAQ
jgi:phosphonate transport system substrate-binding protein